MLMGDMTFVQETYSMGQFMQDMPVFFLGEIVRPFSHAGLPRVVVSPFQPLYLQSRELAALIISIQAPLHRLYLLYRELARCAGQQI